MSCHPGASKFLPAQRVLGRGGRERCLGHTPAHLSYLCEAGAPPAFALKTLSWLGGSLLLFLTFSSSPELYSLGFNFLVANDTGHRVPSLRLLLSLGWHHPQSRGLSGMQSTIQQNASVSVFTGLQGYLSYISLHDVGNTLHSYLISSWEMQQEKKTKPKFHSCICHILTGQFKWSQRKRSAECPGNRSHELHLANLMVCMSGALCDMLYILSSQEHSVISCLGFIST